ncbi:MAG: exodeoxyribonuclease VII small subunit [Bacillota bacterium]
MSDENVAKMSYEAAVARLEEIVRRLEDEAIPLEESLSAFQEGIALSRYCREKLAEIEYRVEYLLKEEREARGELTDNDTDESADEDR